MDSVGFGREIVLFSVFLLAGGMGGVSAAEPEKTAERPVLHVAARSCNQGEGGLFGLSDFGWRIFNRIAQRLGYEVELKGCACSKSADELSASGMDVLPAVFWLPTLTNAYSLVEQPLAKVTVELSAVPGRAVQFDANAPSTWPTIRVARVAGPLDTLPDFLRWVERNAVQATVADYGNLESAVQAVQSGACDMLLMASCATPAGLTHVVDIRQRKVFLAVRRGLPDLCAAVTREIESIKLNEQAWLDSVWQKSFGSAPSTNRVRMAVYFEPGLFDRGEGERIGGYAVEYVKRIAELTGWEIDPVYCRYNDALKALGERKIDLVGGVTITSERMQTMEFARFSTGFYQNYLYSTKLEPIERERQSREVERCSHHQGAGDEARGRLEAYLSARQIRAEITEYPTAQEAIDAYRAGVGDALFSVPAPELPEKEVVITFPMAPWFFCVPRGRTDLLERVESAILRIHASMPGFPEHIQYGYYPTVHNPTLDLTREEKEWLSARVASGRRVRVEVFPPLPLWKEWDGERQQIRGMLKVYLDAITRRTGLKFEFLPPVNLTTARERYSRGEIDIWASYSADLSCLPAGGETLVILNQPITCVVNRFAPNPKPGMTRFAIMECDRSRRDSLTRHGYGGQLVLCQTAEECFNKVVDGDADATLASSSTVLIMLRRFGLNNSIEVRTLPEFAKVDEIAFQSSPKADPLLVSVLEKTMKSLSALDSEQMLRTAMLNEIGCPFMTSMQVAFVVSSCVIVALLIACVFIIMFAIRAKRASIVAEKAGRLKTQFLATISHEIRTPLNVLIGFAEFLNHPGLNPEQVQEYTKGIRFASNALLSPINDVLDLSKLDAGRMDITGICSIPDLFAELKMLFSGMARAKGLSFEMSLRPGIPTIGISSQRLRQILFNLIGNAVKFTERGEVLVEAFAEESTRPNCLNLTFRVKDSGIGVSQERLVAIFNPFEQDITTRGGKVFEGTGLGLPIVKRLVESAGGSVSVDSTPGAGSVFVVRIPNVRIVSAGRAGGTLSVKGVQGAKAKAVDFSNLKVLVADDVALNLRIFSLYLKELGFKPENITVAPDGVQAMDLMMHVRPDVVFTDMWMPEMNGAQLVAAVRKMPWGKDLPVIAVTADADLSATFDISQFDAVLTKPVTAEKVGEVLSVVLRNK